MAINLEMPRKLEAVIDMAHKGAAEIFRPISRKYDLAEHAYPKELDLLASLVDGMGDSGQGQGAGAAGVSTNIRFRSEDRGLVVSIVTEGVLFEAGSAVLRPEGRVILDGIAATFGPHRIMAHEHWTPDEYRRDLPTNVRVQDGNTKAVTEYYAKVIFLCGERDCVLRSATISSWTCLPTSTRPATPSAPRCP